MSNPGCSFRVRIRLWLPRITQSGAGFFHSSLSLRSLIAAYHFWPQPEPYPVTAVRQPVLAILHFDDLNDKPDPGFLAEGFTCELIAKAGQLCSHQLGVIAHDSVVGYQKSRKSVRQIGGTRGRLRSSKAAVLAGRPMAFMLKRALIRVNDQSAIWSEKYDRSLGDLSQIQIAIIQKIGDSLGLNLATADPGKRWDGHPLKTRLRAKLIYARSTPARK